MYRFGPHSTSQIATIRPELQKICRVAIQWLNISVLDGYRNERDQNLAYSKGHSTKKWPDSLHNIYPSPAVDLALWPINWEDLERFSFFAGQIIAIARDLRIPVIWGGDWDSDTFVKEHSFIDRPHFQLIHWKENTNGNTIGNLSWKTH